MYQACHPLKVVICESFQNIIANEYNLKLLPTDLIPLLARPPKKEMGQLAFACFTLAKSLKKSPAAIASDLATKIVHSDFTVRAMGPYLNIDFKAQKLAEYTLPSLMDKSEFSKNLTKNAPKTMVEFSQPNTHKEMHVGHMRNLCLGDALIRMQRYLGIPTVSTTFPGDVGTHVAKCLWYFKFHNTSPVPDERKGAWLGKLYTKGNNLLEDQKGTDKEEENRKVLTEILAQIEQKQGEYYDLWCETRKWSIETMQSVYDWAHVDFDTWYWESDVDSDSVNFIKKLYQEGKLTKDQGAIGMDLSEDKLGFCLLLKTDGNGLYATKDVELARKKFEDHKIDKNIYVVDNRQALHFKQVFKVLEKIGFKQAKDCYHLQYEMVELPDGAMSSRKGNIVPLQALIDQMQAKIRQDYLEKYLADWGEEEVVSIAHQVAEGAIKYGMTSVDSNKKIIFDMQAWLRLDGESGPYIQYVCARIHSLLDKLQLNLQKEKIHWDQLSHPKEVALMLELANFNETIQAAVQNYKTSLLTSHLYEVARSFNSFYADCSVGKAENEELKKARAALCLACENVLSKGLSLLGITAPKRM